MTLFITLLLISIVTLFAIVNQKSKKKAQTKESLSKPNEVPLSMAEGEPTIPSPSEFMTTEVAKGESKKKRETLRYFCKSDNGYGYISVWPKDQMYPDHMEFDIAVTSYRKGLMKYTGEFKGRLEEEPTNEYDPKAIKILAEDGHHYTTRRIINNEIEN